MKNEEDKIELRSEEFQEVLNSVPSWILRWGIAAIAAVVVLILGGSAIFKYPDVINTKLTLTGTRPAVGIVAKSSGKLEKLFVNDNQMVKQNDYLAVIDNPAKTEDVVFLKKYLNSLNLDAVTDSPPKEMNLGNIQSSYSAFYIALYEYIEFRRLKYLDVKIKLTENRIMQYEEQYIKLIRQKKIVGEQLKIHKAQYLRDSLLNIKGVMSKEEIERSYSQYLQGCLSFESMCSSMDNMQIQISQIKESLFDTKNQFTEKDNSFKNRINTQITQLRAEVQTWEMNYVIMAPIDGKISFTKYWIENQNISGGDEIFNIIPTDKGHFIGKALLPIARSGKVKIGQKVNIRFENFQDTEFGTVKGIVRNISLVPTTVKDADNYIVEIELINGLKTTYDKTLPFLSEMKGQADIITDDLSLLQRFFLPLRNIWNNSIN